MNVYRATTPGFAVRATDAYLGRLGTYRSPPPAFGPLCLDVLRRLASRGVKARTYSPAVRLKLVANPSGVQVSFNRVDGADGATYAGYFAPGRYDVVVRSPFYRAFPLDGAPFPDGADAALRELPVAVALEPGYAYPFPRLRRQNGKMQPTLLRGLIDCAPASAGGFLIEAVRIRTVAPYLTDESGQWLLVLPDDFETGEIAIRITAPDGRRRTVGALRIVAGEATTAPVYRPNESAKR